MISRKEFREQANIIASHSGAIFYRLHLAHCRHLQGDGTAAVVFAHIMNLLNLKCENQRDRRYLRRNEMWFKCPAGGIQDKLNMKGDKQRRAIAALEKQGMIQTQSKGVPNTLWVKVSVEKLQEIEKDDSERESSVPGDSSYRDFQLPGNTGTDSREVREPSAVDCGNYLDKKQSKKQKEETDAGGKPPHRLPENNDDSFDARIAILSEQLRRIITNTKGLGIIGFYKLTSWSGHLISITKKYGVDYLEETMKLYAIHAKNWKGLALPRIRNANNFRLNFKWLDGKLRAAESTAKAICDISKEAQSIAKELSHLNWPKGSASQLPVVVQVSLDNYRQFQKQRKRVEETCKNEKVQSLAEHLGRCLHPADTFVREWYEKENRRIQDWDEWPGKLSTFKIDNKYFRTQCRQWSEEFCTDAKRWDSFVSYLEIQ